MSAPSICDKNAATSWSARGRLYAEAPLHGAMQAGYAAGGASALHRIPLRGPNRGVDAKSAAWARNSLRIIRRP